jgi:peptidoglycan/LPS O-acetylase OafA/YrhL
MAPAPPWEGFHYVITRYIPALDGLRAVAVLAVMLFHAELAIAKGGFLGVSLFFTISGYLITSLLLHEHRRTGHIVLRSFYSRRWRRLVPAAWCCIAGVLVAWPLWSASQQAALPGDGFASLLHVANWRFAFAATSYQNLFLGQPSPLAHYWSLAIEEQFYVVIPIVAALCLRRSRALLAAVVATLLAGSVTATLLTSDRDLVYNGTHTRAAEILVGVLLALAPAAVLRRFGQTVGCLAAAVLVALIGVTSISSDWVYGGGLVGLAVVSASLIAAVVNAPETSTIVRVLAWRPLVAVGKWSYAIYLIHWPVFLVLDSERTGLQPWALLIVEFVVTLVLAAAFTTLVERPIRDRRLFGRPRRAAMASVGAVCGLTFLLLAAPSPEFTDNERLLAAGEAGGIAFEPSPGGASADLVAGLPAASPASMSPVLVVGSDPLVAAALRDRGIAVVDRTDPACPITPAAEVRLLSSEVVDTSSCPDAATSWPALAAATGATRVVLSFGPIDEGFVRTADEVGFPLRSDLVEQSKRWRHVGDALARTADSFPSSVSIHLARFGPRTSELQRELIRFELGESRVDQVFTMVDPLEAALVKVAGADDPAVGGPTRVLVVGDSTSLFMATALHRAGAGVLDVTWVGENGCPLVGAEAVRSSADEPWTPLQCPAFVDLLTPRLTATPPDFVLLMVSGSELLEQRYPGDPEAHVAGDAAFTAAHDVAMAAFVAPLERAGIPLLVTDSPQLRPTKFIKAESASPARIEAWNAQVRRWADSSSLIALFPYAAAVDAYTAAEGDITIDGLHANVDKLTQLLADGLLDQLLTTYRQLDPSP